MLRLKPIVSSCAGMMLKSSQIIPSTFYGPVLKIPYTSNSSSVGDTDKPSPFPSHPDLYKSYLSIKDQFLASKLNDPNRFQPISMREDRSDWELDMVIKQSIWKFRSVYRGFSVMKNWNDYTTFHQLFYYVRPATVIELGTFTGGSALWMADQMKLIDNPCQIYSIDLNSLLEDLVKQLKPDNLTFLQGDAYALEKTLTPDFMKSLPHPLVVVEDAHENLFDVMNFFHHYMKEGDYFIIEDTSPDLPADFMIWDNDPYRPSGRQLLDELKKFLEEYKEHFAVDSFYTDLYGYNGGWHWHGYIRKMK